MKGLNILFAVFVLALLLVASGAMYTVDETEQVVVTQFGMLIGEPITKAGLYFKIPLIQTANYFDKRLMQWDGDPNQIPTSEKRFIWVETTARWRIVDPLKFMQSVRTEASAQTRLDDIIDASTRDIISSHRLVEVIRNSNRILEEAKAELSDDPEEQFGKTELETIEYGRDKLSEKIWERARQSITAYGIELLDVRLKRINYVEEVRQKVYERMISERKRAAEKYRSEGQGEKAEIEGLMQKELNQIQSEAYKTAQEIQGEADAKAIKIYADAYNRDPEFYSFVKTLETYRSTINTSTTLMLSTENDFYEYLNGIKATPLN
ncbi:MAG TPA: protease modulator HflC [Candidatus Omnitrophota bacterium]|nr:protease modulator HflC [Candidatus Omnitrophota bacterium]